VRRTQDAHLYLNHLSLRDFAQIVTQLALLLNPKGRVITTAGSPAKCKQLKEMGCHAAINYKDKDWRKQLGAAMKDEDKSGKKGNGWADVYFDNGELEYGIRSLRYLVKNRGADVNVLCSIVALSWRRDARLYARTAE
jgi:NADPH:quinone reductase-like Zn-dependent oxidoreductase